MGRPAGQPLRRNAEPLRWTRLLRTTTVRIALLYAVLFSVSVGALFALVYWTTETVLARQQAQAVEADLATLLDRYRMFGLPGVGQEIWARTRPERMGSGIYLLTDPAREPLVGNLGAWPAAARQEGPWLVFPVERRSAAEPEALTARAIAVRLPNGYHLLVGQSMETQAQLRGATFEAFAWIAAIVLLLGLGGGLLLSRNLLRRIEAINRVSERVMQGEIGERIPVGGGRDEFDRLAANLNAMLDEIQHLMGSLRAVTHNIAHDLRSPLTRLRGRLESVLEERDEERRRELVERAIGDADSLLATFRALLSIADAEAGGGRADMTEVDLGALVGDVAELYQPLAEERRIALALQAAPGVCVRANRHLLFQAAANLVDNALKYAPPDSAVTLAARHEADGAAALVVADRGPGIPPADRERVLERFVRLEASRTTPGSGLGLSLVTAIVRLHDAELRLEDNAPGLRAVIRFPRRDALGGWPREPLAKPGPIL